MWKFSFFLLLILLLSQGGKCTSLRNCYCEIDQPSESAPTLDDEFKRIEFEMESKKITLETVDGAVLEKIQNQLEKINARNELLFYRLETLRDRFDEHERLLKKLNEKPGQVDLKIGLEDESTFRPHKRVKIDLQDESTIGPNKNVKVGLEEESTTRPHKGVKIGLEDEIWIRPNKNVPSDEENVPQRNLTCTKTKTYPRNCAEATATRNQSGLYTIQIDSFSNKPFLVYCDDRTHDGSWTMIQRRMDGSIDFYRDWASYKTGFGNLDGEFFIGLDKLHALTTDVPQELLITMSDFEGVTKYAKYDSFAIGNEAEQYALKVLGAYSGDAGNSLSHHAGQMFTTKDRQNDQHKSNCATQYKGAWWYRNCHESNLNGLYLRGDCAQNQSAQGVVWVSWHGYGYSLKSVQILIRPKKEKLFLF